MTWARVVGVPRGAGVPRGVGVSRGVGVPRWRCCARARAAGCAE